MRARCAPLAAATSWRPADNSRAPASRNSRAPAWLARFRIPNLRAMLGLVPGINDFFSPATRPRWPDEPGDDTVSRMSKESSPKCLNSAALGSARPCPTQHIMITRTILHALWAAIVFVFAVAVALSVLFVLGALWIGDELRAAAPNDPMLRHGAAPVFGMVLFVGTVTPALTVLPAAVAGAAMRIRSWMYYVIAGGAAMATIPVLASSPNDQLPALPAGQYMTIFAAAGFVGGFVYWLLAGRNA